jgi:hypothetical protein
MKLGGLVLVKLVSNQLFWSVTKSTAANLNA